ncbi:PepSY domain-containing protein [Streptomyces sp. B-S-A8]|uniref:PepSY domain-containing protein n=1 Tax=Streptomyces solicavernae TaxID=3043614 RepID=A0ABT6RT21_9ACTN|nr:PepSY domain-containing protein [Streptomyces sp. B-S-A8]MDI3387591.1 PepSY domain-containing protein [Streptomyces sp. B-S-A8]
MLTQRVRAPRRLRAVGYLCAVAAAGGLVTGCGSDGSGGEKTSEAAAAKQAAAAAQTESPSPAASPTESPSPATSPTESPSPAASPTESPGGTASPSPGSTLTDDRAERKALLPKVKVTYDKALTAAVEAVPESKPVAIELQADPDGAPWWEAEVAKADGSASTVRVDAVSGQADEPQADSDADADEKRQLADLLGKAKITPQEAADVATGQAEGTVSSVELDDTDQGATIWSVDVIDTKTWNKTSYDIDATNKKVLKEEVDRD